MKAVYRISIILNILFAGYILIRGGELLLQDYVQKKSGVSEEPAGYVYMQSEETASSSDHVTCDTIYTVLEYDLSTGRQEVYQEVLPETLIGMNRKQVIEWVDDYNLSTTLEDLENGLKSMELLSFSSSEIRVRKRIESVQENVTEPIEQPNLLLQNEPVLSVSGNEMIYGCILAQDGLLTVYDGMRRHVILYTDISLFDLPEQEQQEILEGKNVASEQELFNLLESYSS